MNYFQHQTVSKHNTTEQICDIDRKIADLRNNSQKLEKNEIINGRLNYFIKYKLSKQQLIDLGNIIENAVMENENINKNEKQMINQEENIGNEINKLSQQQENEPDEDEMLAIALSQSMIDQEIEIQDQSGLNIQKEKMNQNDLFKEKEDILNEKYLDDNELLQLAIQQSLSDNENHHIKVANNNQNKDKQSCKPTNYLYIFSQSILFLYNDLHWNFKMASFLMRKTKIVESILIWMQIYIQTKYNGNFKDIECAWGIILKLIIYLNDYLKAEFYRNGNINTIMKILKEEQFKKLEKEKQKQMMPIQILGIKSTNQKSLISELCLYLIFQVMKSVSLIGYEQNISEFIVQLFATFKNHINEQNNLIMKLDEYGERCLYILHSVINQCLASSYQLSHSSSSLYSFISQSTLRTMYNQNAVQLLSGISTNYLHINDGNIRDQAINIILHIICSGCELKKEDEKKEKYSNDNQYEENGISVLEHTYYEQLTKDGTINQLKNVKKKIIYGDQIQIILAMLLKGKNIKHVDQMQNQHKFQQNLLQHQFLQQQLFQFQPQLFQIGVGGNTNDMILFDLFEQITSSQSSLQTIRFALKALYGLAQSNRHAIVFIRDFNLLIQSQRIKTDALSYHLLLQLIDILSNEGTNDIKQKLLDHDIGSLFIQILALLDFYHRRTTRKYGSQNGNKQISLWLESRLLILSHSLVLLLRHIHKKHTNEGVRSDKKRREPTLEHCDVMDAVALIEDLLMKCNRFIDVEIRVEIQSIISNIKEREEEGETMKAYNLLYWEVIGDTTSQIKVMKFRGELIGVEQRWEEYSKLRMGLMGIKETLREQLEKKRLFEIEQEKEKMKEKEKENKKEKEKDQEKNSSSLQQVLQQKYIFIQSSLKMNENNEQDSEIKHQIDNFEIKINEKQHNKDQSQLQQELKTQQNLNDENLTNLRENEDIDIDQQITDQQVDSNQQDEQQNFDIQQQLNGIYNISIHRENEDDEQGQDQNENENKIKEQIIIDESSAAFETESQISFDSQKSQQSQISHKSQLSQKSQSSQQNSQTPYQEQNDEWSIYHQTSYKEENKKKIVPIPHKAEQIIRENEDEITKNISQPSSSSSSSSSSQATSHSNPSSKSSSSSKTNHTSFSDTGTVRTMTSSEFAQQNSANISSVIVSSAEIPKSQFSRTFRIDGDFYMGNVYAILHNYESEDININQQMNNIYNDVEYQQNNKDNNQLDSDHMFNEEEDIKVWKEEDRVVDSLFDVLDDDKDREGNEDEDEYNNQNIEQTGFNKEKREIELQWACEVIIPWIAQILNKWKQRFIKSKSVSLRKDEKKAIQLLGYIAEEGMKSDINGYYNQYQQQFDSCGLTYMFEWILDWVESVRQNEIESEKEMSKRINLSLIKEKVKEKENILEEDMKFGKNLQEIDLNIIQKQENDEQIKERKEKEFVYTFLLIFDALIKHDKQMSNEEHELEQIIFQSNFTELKNESEQIKYEVKRRRVETMIDKLHDYITQKKQQMYQYNKQELNEQNEQQNSPKQRKKIDIEEDQDDVEEKDEEETNEQIKEEKEELVVFLLASSLCRYNVTSNKENSNQRQFVINSEQKQKIINIFSQYMHINCKCPKSITVSYIKLPKTASTITSSLQSQQQSQSQQNQSQFSKFRLISLIFNTLLIFIEEKKKIQFIYKLMNKSQDEILKEKQNENNVKQLIEQENIVYHIQNNLNLYSELQSGNYYLIQLVICSIHLLLKLQSFENENNNDLNINKQQNNKFMKINEINIAPTLRLLVRNTRKRRKLSKQQKKNKTTKTISSFYSQNASSKSSHIQSYQTPSSSSLSSYYVWKLISFILLNQNFRLSYNQTKFLVVDTCAFQLMCLWLCFGGGELRQGDGKEGQDANESGIDEQRIIQTFGVLYECYRNVLSADQERDNSCQFDYFKINLQMQHYNILNVKSSFDIKLEQQLKLVQLLEEQLEVDGFYEENDVLCFMVNKNVILEAKFMKDQL